MCGVRRDVASIIEQYKMQFFSFRKRRQGRQNEYLWKTVESDLEPIERIDHRELTWLIPFVDHLVATCST